MNHFYKKIDLDDYIYRLHHSLQNKRIPSSIAAGQPYHEAKRQYINIKVQEWIEEKKQEYYMEQRILQKQCFFNADNPSPLLSSINKTPKNSFLPPLFSNSLDEQQFHENETVSIHSIEESETTEQVKEHPLYPSDCVINTLSTSDESNQEKTLSQISEPVNNTKDFHDELKYEKMKNSSESSFPSFLQPHEHTNRNISNHIIHTLDENTPLLIEPPKKTIETLENQNITPVLAIADTTLSKEINDKLLSSGDGLNISHIEKAWEKTTMSLGSAKLIPIPLETQQDYPLGLEYPIPDIEHEHILSSGSNIWLNQQKTTKQLNKDNFEKEPIIHKINEDKETEESDKEKAIKDSLKQLNLTISELSSRKDDTPIFGYSSEETLTKALSILQSKPYPNPFSSFVSQNDNIIKGKKMGYPSLSLNFSLNTKDIYDVVSNTFVSTITQLHQKISHSFDKSKAKILFFSVEDTLLKISTSLYYLHFCYFLLQKELIVENVRRSNQKLPEKQISFHFMNEIIHQVSYLLVSVEKINSLLHLQFTQVPKHFSFDKSSFFEEPVEEINNLLHFYNNIVKKNYFNNFHSQVSCEHTSYYLSSEPPEMSEKEIILQIKNQLNNL